eukprot:5532411-Pleurochrysis_carterae.AAC.1
MNKVAGQKRRAGGGMVRGKCERRRSRGGVQDAACKRVCAKGFVQERASRKRRARQTDKEGGAWRGRDR